MESVLPGVPRTNLVFHKAARALGLGVGDAVTKVCIFSVKSLLFSLVSLSKLESYQYQVFVRFISYSNFHLWQSYQTTFKERI